MKLIIDISDKTYEIIRDMMYFYNPQRSGRAETKEIITAIKQGTPLDETLENQKTGHWIEKNVNQDGTHNIYCSNCNNYQKFKGHANSYNARTKLKYCPNCGAVMKGE